MGVKQILAPSLLFHQVPNPLRPSACEKEKFDLKIETETDTWKESGSSDVLLVLTIYERSYVEEEQYVIYDFNSFFADVGGFMGLALGSSMLKIYDEFVDLWSRVRFRKMLQ